MYIKEGRFVYDLEPQMITPTNGGSPYVVINTRMAFNTWARGKQRSLFLDVSFSGFWAEWIQRNIMKDGKTGKGMMVRVGGEIYDDEYQSQKDQTTRQTRRLDVKFVDFAPLVQTTGTRSNTQTAGASRTQNGAGTATAAQEQGGGTAVAERAPEIPEKETWDLYDGADDLFGGGNSPFPSE
jgi:single-stranded DNA-binding protein